VSSLTVRRTWEKRNLAAADDLKVQTVGCDRSQETHLKTSPAFFSAESDGGRKTFPVIVCPVAALYTKWRDIMISRPLMILALSLALVAAGCSASGSDSASVPKTPDEMGQRISDDYYQFLSELKTMVEPKPAPADLAPKLGALRDKYIQRFVAIGKAQQSMNQEDRLKVSAANMRANSEKQSKDPGVNDLKWLNEATSHYGKVDSDNTGKMLAKAGIISQYAYPDLLKKQEPEEAKRLGIE